LAFTRNELEYFGNTAELADWCVKNGDFCGYVVAEVRRYFVEVGAEFTGFLSVPIAAPSEAYEEHEQRSPIAVLNVQWERTEKLGTGHGAKTFVEAIFALRMLLADQLSTDFRGRLTDSFG
jgi:hypothetical protein